MKSTDQRAALPCCLQDPNRVGMKSASSINRKQFAIKPTLWIGMLCTAVLTGCAGQGFRSEPEPGLYAVQQGKLQRLDGNRQWEMRTWNVRSDLSPSTSFLVRNPLLACQPEALREQIKLRRVGWVRSEIDSDGNILPVEGARWQDVPLEQQTVPVQYVNSDTACQEARIVPEKNLEPGLYTLQMDLPTGPVKARLGVGWQKIDKRRFAAVNCVDRYAGDGERYRPCSDQRQPPPHRWLKVHLVKPEIRSSRDQNRELVVKGVVVNTSERPRKVPLLEATLLTDQGDVVRRWQIQTPAIVLKPGGSTPFESQLPNPPSGALNVHVTLSALNPNRAGEVTR